MQLVSNESDGATCKFQPQEIARAQTQHEEHLNDLVRHPMLPFQLANLTSIFPIESQEDNFEHHSMIINVGEDVEEKIMSYFREAPHSGIILSARGSLSRVTLNLNSRRITYEVCDLLLFFPFYTLKHAIGMYNILSLKGGYQLANAKDELKETHYMNIILRTADGTRTLGGPVAGSLIAATNVQVTLLRFKSR
ncbi:AT-hook motif nuclear-localized protein 1 [Vitis vinifera]|uniref:AT-hook motif nuclear-localized protein n=1 Tax=Vitis vinifera TaxID=29760 RepID=A0A438HH05_VITVI|nr:AT-hook motif nuclear-localized protein 1 [Vitis vinifera]